MIFPASGHMHIFSLIECIDQCLLDFAELIHIQRIYADCLRKYRLKLWTDLRDWERNDCKTSLIRLDIAVLDQRCIRTILHRQFLLVFLVNWGFFFRLRHK